MDNRQTAFCLVSESKVFSSRIWVKECKNVKVKPVWSCDIQYNTVRIVNLSIAIQRDCSRLEHTRRGGDYGQSANSCWPRRPVPRGVFSEVGQPILHLQWSNRFFFRLKKSKIKQHITERIQNINFYFLLASPAVLSYIGGYKGPQTVEIIIQVQRRQLLEICLPMK